MHNRVIIWPTFCLATVLAAGGELVASQDTIGPNGIRSSGLGLTGSGIAIGQVEQGRPGKHGMDTDPARLNDTIRPTEVYIGDNSIFTTVRL